MMMQTIRKVVTAVMMLAGGFSGLTGGAALAGDWVGIPDDALAGALVSREMRFEDGSSWGFFADGRVISGDFWGRWSQGDEALCLIWPDAEAVCYQVEINGIDLRFTPVAGGPARIARYNDL
ncbi:hypothetical protein HOY34_09010 [Xinfangfangia sp. D13-10-4-6]|uniref:hypothetical protein n=1 Tax=Pseudogemmobacter hezensis TaxID=2737662 RepID=UPI00155255F0|nr:hypothetical protein [Pseudogemmobacter hezensis]NPD15337.1 hypothetical protein [Pseudogemmobacter hezensis]